MHLHVAPAIIGAGRPDCETPIGRHALASKGGGVHRAEAPEQSVARLVTSQALSVGFIIVVAGAVIRLRRGTRVPEGVAIVRDGGARRGRVVGDGNNHGENDDEGEVVGNRKRREEGIAIRVSSGDRGAPQQTLLRVFRDATTLVRLG